MKHCLHTDLPLSTTWPIALLLLSMTILSSCKLDPNQQIDEGKVVGEVYTSQEIGWTITIPEGWNVISKNKIEENNLKGEEAVEEIIGDYDYSGLKHLISFQKNKFNVFQSTSEPFKLEYEGEWEENNAGVKELIYATYINQGIKVDTSSTTTTIDGFEFEVFKCTIYGPKGKVLLNQELHSRFMNGFDFGVSINYNNEHDKEVMVNAWKNSKFERR